MKTRIKNEPALALFGVFPWALAYVEKEHGSPRRYVRRVISVDARGRKKISSDFHCAPRMTGSCAAPMRRTVAP